MVACTNGASVKTGVNPATQILVSRALWEQVTGTPATWFDSFLNEFTPSTILASDLCALNLDDPALPSVTTLAAALTGDLDSVIAIQRYLNQKLQYVAFQANCVCNAPAQTCSGAVLSDGTWSGFGCTSGNESVGNQFTIDSSCVSTGAWVYNFQGVTSTFTVDLWDTTATSSPVATATNVSVPANTHGFKAWDAGDFTPVVGRSYVISLRKVNLSCYPGNIGAPNWTINPYAHMTGDVFNASGFGFPSTALGAVVGVHPQLCSSTAPTTPTAPHVDSQPPTITVPPSWSCSSVGDICTRLQQVSDRLDWLRRDVDILQRFGLPFGYLDSTVHSGLTGSGSFVVSRALGFQVILTATPTGTQILPGNPAYVWDVGWMSIDNPDGMIAEKRITRQSFVWLPENCQLAETFQYFLNPGMSISVEILLPEAATL